MPDVIGRCHVQYPKTWFCVKQGPRSDNHGRPRAACLRARSGGLAAEGTTASGDEAMRAGSIYKASETGNRNEIMVMVYSSHAGILSMTLLRTE